jgi:hypothetical protein
MQEMLLALLSATLIGPVMGGEREDASVQIRAEIVV